MTAPPPLSDQAVATGLPPCDLEAPKAQGFIAKWAYVIFFAGLICTTSAPIFMRLSEVGPLATGAARLTLALPLLVLMLRFEPADAAPAGRGLDAKTWRILILAGVFFACDLALWNSSVTLTSIANAAFLANFAPVFVVLGSWLLFKERIGLLFLAGLVLGIAGSALMMADSLQVTTTGFKGDVLSVVAAAFYAAYLLTVSRSRKRASTMTLMTVSTAAAAAVLWLMAILIETTLLPVTLEGWLVLIGTALLTQVAGQTLIALSLGYVSANFSALILLLQPVVPGFAAWLLFDETLSRLQVLGALAIIAGLALARPRTSVQPPAP